MSLLTKRNAIRVVGGLAALLLIAFAVGSLGDANRPSASRTVSGTDAPPELPGSGKMQSGAAGLASDEAVVGSVNAALPSLGDRVVRTADLTVEVKESRFDNAWAEAFRIATRFEGRVMNASRGENGRPIPLDDASKNRFTSGDLTIRVPAGRFEDATNALRALGAVRADSTSAQDVSEEYVDLESRARSLRAEERALLALFAKAKTVSDTLAIQVRLSDVQSQLEQITGRLRYLDERTTFSTVSLHLVGPGVILPHEEEGPSFSKAWETAVDGLIRMGSAAIIVGVWLTPFAILAAIALGVRRTRRPQPQP